MEDEQIVELYWQRSDQAIGETSRKYGRYCHAIAVNICGSPEDAEECVNDTWLRAWNRMPDQRPRVLSAFLGRITRNLAIDRVKARSRDKRGGGEAALILDELAECVPGGTEPERSLEQKELEEAVGRFVALLPEAEKRLFVLRYWYAASMDEMAGRLSLTRGQVAGRLFRTRRKLQNYLKEEGLW